MITLLFEALPLDVMDSLLHMSDWEFKFMCLKIQSVTVNKNLEQ